MSDFAWIALIIVVYMVLIKPLVEGIMQGGNGKPGAGKAQQGMRKGKPEGDDYVDYEEIK